MSTRPDPLESKTLSAQSRRSGRLLWIGLVVLFAIGTGVSLFMALTAPSRVQSAGNDYAVAVVHNEWDPVWTSTAMKPVTGSRYTDLRSVAETRIFNDGRTVRLSVWRRDGEVVFSTAHALVGRKPDVATSALDDALKGAVTSTVFDPSSKQSKLPGIEQKTLRTYV